MKYIYIIAALFLLSITGWYFFYRQPERPLTKLIETPSVYKNASSDLIVVERPTPGSVLDKNFAIEGMARGTWFFEASFPVNVVDKFGNILVATPAQTKADWMTQNFVPFRVDIKIPATYSGPATIILRKDNPSGLPEHDASVSFNVFIK
jgi:hypothetical protein